VHFLHCIVHVLPGLLLGVEFLLLIGIEQRTNLGVRILDYGLRFLHRILVNGDELRLGLIEDRLHFCLLVGGEIQRLGQMLKSKFMPLPAAGTRAIMGLGNGETA